MIANFNFNQVFLIGAHFSSIKTTNALQFPTFDDFKNKFDLNNTQNATILIKGSRGMALERVLELL